MKTSIIVKANFSGSHFWKNAPNEVAFLRQPHDHIFFVEAEIEIKELDRELEFFMVRRNIDNFLNNFRDYGRGQSFEYSCEQLATFIIEYLKTKYGEREYIVTVSEDNFNAGRVYYEPL